MSAGHLHDEHAGIDGDDSPEPSAIIRRHAVKGAVGMAATCTHFSCLSRLVSLVIAKVISLVTRASRGFGEKMLSIGELAKRTA